MIHYGFEGRTITKKGTVERRLGINVQAQLEALRTQPLTFGPVQVPTPDPDLEDQSVDELPHGATTE
jgi:hypothetical protein